MRIAIDARLNAYRQGGIPQYTRQLLTALAEVARDDEFISLQHRDHLRPLAVAPNVTRRTVLTPPHHRFEQWTLPLEVLLARPDVLHCPDFIAPVRRSCPAVVTIHDLAFLHYPEILDDAARVYYGRIKQNAARADAIIAVSEVTRQDVAQFLDIAIEDITMIHEAAAPIYSQIELREGEARVLGSTPVAADTFMLFVSTLEPRKNVPTLLHALRICLDRRPDRAYRLVVAGARGWRDTTIFETARDLRLGDRVLFVGSIGQYDLRWLYNACRLYINPSLYEGFGLPLLEAMACGAACLAAATSSLPEIGGDAAVYIPPLDAGLWADAIEALWDDQDRRAELSRLGRARAQRFSWTRAARETLKVYQRVGTGAAKPALAPASGRGQLERPAEVALGAQGGGRTCLRCGAAMLSSQLQRGILMAQPDMSDDCSPAARAWICTRCGHVELVMEQIAPFAATEAAAPIEPPAVAEAAAVAPDDEDAQADAVAVGQPPTSQDQPEREPVAAPGDMPAHESPHDPTGDEAEHTGEPRPIVGLDAPAAEPPHPGGGPARQERRRAKTTLVGDTTAEPAESRDGAADVDSAPTPSDTAATTAPAAEPDPMAIEAPYQRTQNGKPPASPLGTGAMRAPEQPAAEPAEAAKKQRQPRTKRRRSS
ncbi:MAG: glycosyltransferase [Roseiflexaceae bacterium]